MANKSGDVKAQIEQDKLKEIKNKLAGLKRTRVVIGNLNVLVETLKQYLQKIPADKANLAVQLQSEIDKMLLISQQLTLMIGRIDTALKDSPEDTKILDACLQEVDQTIKQLFSEGIARAQEFPKLKALLRREGIALVQQPDLKNTAEAAAAVGTKTTASVEDWMNPDVIDAVEKVLKDLSESGKNVGVLPGFHKEFRRVYNKVKAAGEKADENDKQWLHRIVHTPGWGHVKGQPQVYISDTNKNVLANQAKLHMDNAKLAGTEPIVKPVLKQFKSFISRRVGRGDQKKLIGEQVPLAKKKADNKFKIFCVWGPPGTGKTTVAQQLAESMGMGYKDFAMDQVKDIEDITGRPTVWQGGGRPNIIHQTMLATGKEDVFVCLDEVDKLPPDVLMALGNFLGSQATFEDRYLNTKFDKRRAAIFLTANNLSMLPPHVRSRIEPIYFGGYKDEQKIEILKNMAFSVLSGEGRAHTIMEFVSTDARDLARTFEGVDANVESFEGFRKADAGEEDVIKFIVENYITEAGVREAEGLLNEIIAAATEEYDETGQKTKINVDFVKKTLGFTNEVKKIKDLSSTIIEQAEHLNKIKAEIDEHLTTIFKDASKAPLLKDTLSDLLKELEQQRTTLLRNENEIIRLLKRRLAHPKANKETISTQIREHESELEKLEKLTENTRKEIEKYVSGKAAEEYSEEAMAKQEVIKSAENFLSQLGTHTVESRDQESAIRLFEQLLKMAQGQAKGSAAAIDPELFVILTGFQAKLAEVAKTLPPNSPLAELLIQFEALPKSPKSTTAAKIGASVGSSQTGSTVSPEKPAKTEPATTKPPVTEPSVPSSRVKPSATDVTGISDIAGPRRTLSATDTTGTVVDLETARSSVAVEQAKNLLGTLGDKDIALDNQAAAIQLFADLLQQAQAQIQAAKPGGKTGVSAVDPELIRILTALQAKLTKVETKADTVPSNATTAFTTASLPTLLSQFDQLGKVIPPSRSPESTAPTFTPIIADTTVRQPAKPISPVGENMDDAAALRAGERDAKRATGTKQSTISGEKPSTEPRTQPSTQPRTQPSTEAAVGEQEEDLEFDMGPATLGADVDVDANVDADADAEARPAATARTPARVTPAKMTPERVSDTPDAVPAKVSAKVSNTSVPADAVPAKVSDTPDVDTTRGISGIPGSTKLSDTSVENTPDAEIPAAGTRTAATAGHADMSAKVSDTLFDTRSTPGRDQTVAPSRDRTVVPGRDSAVMPSKDRTVPPSGKPTVPPVPSAPSFGRDSAGPSSRTPTAPPGRDTTVPSSALLFGSSKTSDLRSSRTISSTTPDVDPYARPADETLRADESLRADDTLRSDDSLRSDASLRATAKGPRAFISATEMHDTNLDATTNLDMTSRRERPDYGKSGLLGHGKGGMIGMMAAHRDAYLERAIKVGHKRGTKLAASLVTDAGMKDLCQKMSKSIDKKSHIADTKPSETLLHTEYDQRQKERYDAGKSPISYEEWKRNRDIKIEVFENVKIEANPVFPSEYNIQIKDTIGGVFETKAYVKLLSEAESPKIPELPPGRKIELGFTSAQPGDKEIEILLENAKEISRRTGNPKIHFEQCEDCPEKLARIIDLASAMKLHVTYDSKSRAALERWEAESRRPSPTAG